MGILYHKIFSSFELVGNYMDSFCSQLAPNRPEHRSCPIATLSPSQDFLLQVRLKFDLRLQDLSL